MKQKAKATLKKRGKTIKTKNLKVKTQDVTKMTPEQLKKAGLTKRLGKKAPAKMMKKSPAKKPLVGKQKNLPDALKKKILDSPAKMKKAAMKMKKESMAMLKKSTMMMKKAGAMKMKMKKK